MQKMRQTISLAISEMINTMEDPTAPKSFVKIKFKTIEVIAPTNAPNITTLSYFIGIRI